MFGSQANGGHRGRGRIATKLPSCGGSGTGCATRQPVQRLLVEGDHAPLPRLRRRDPVALRLPGRERPVGRGSPLEDETPTATESHRKAATLLAARRPVRPAAVRGRERVDGLGRSQCPTGLLHRHHAPRRPLAPLGSGSRHRVRRDEVPPDGLAEGGCEQRVQVPELRLPHTRFVQRRCHQSPSDTATRVSGFAPRCPP